MQYDKNLVLSAIEPETIVAAVAQNTKLKTNVDAMVKPSAGLSMKVANLANKSILGIPTNPNKASSPIIKPKPNNMKTTVPIQKSIKFFMMILPAFFALVKPVSTIAKPACIKNTNAAPIRYQNSIVIIYLFLG